MARSKRLGLIAAFTLFAAILLPQSSYAQYPPFIVTGVWSGTESFTTMDYFDTTVIGQSSGSNVPAELTLQFYFPARGAEIPFFLGMSLTGFQPSNPFSGYHDFFEFNSQVANGFTYSTVYHGVTFSGNFLVTYQADFSDGFIDTSGGSAVADATILTSSTSGYDSLSFVSFQSSVPEPSSLALATSGLLALLVFAGIRGFFPR
jgi:PEP-CTERM motif